LKRSELSESEHRGNRADADKQRDFHQKQQFLRPAGKINANTITRTTQSTQINGNLERDFRLSDLFGIGKIAATAALES
jgi:hypothetical protein